MQSETQELIKTWYGLATKNSGGIDSDLRDVYSRFMAVWVAFNALYNSRLYSGRMEDWEQVNAFAEEELAKVRHAQLLRDDDQYRRAVLFLKENGVYRVRNERSLKAVLNATRKIRNNLFHGKKLPGNLEDEGLVEAGYVVLSKLMLIEPYLNGR